METIADEVISPPDVAVPHPVYDMSEQQPIGGRVTGVYGFHGQTPVRQHSSQHPPQMIVCDKLYQDRLTVCSYSTFVGGGRNEHDPDGDYELDTRTGATTGGHSKAVDDSTFGFGGSVGMRPPVSSYSTGNE